MPRWLASQTSTEWICLDHRVAPEVVTFLTGVVLLCVVRVFLATFFSAYCAMQRNMVRHMER